MTRELLQEMVEKTDFSDLSPRWQLGGLETFSRDKQLWDYQQAALEHALIALQQYYDAWIDYRPGEHRGRERRRKVEYVTEYERHGLDLDDLHIELKDHTLKNRELIAMLKDYYRPAREEKLQVNTRVTFDYQDFINRMCFWMATGSGKTLVLIKLIQVLHQLITLQEIPDHDILILTYRDDLIDQIAAHVREFNAWHSGLSIRLYSLKAYEQVKYNARPLPGELPVFIYRSDNLSDEAGTKILDFRNYENDGQWYVLLDEAHKGDRDESKRQHIYSILSRNGFLFNFSATFTDERDVATTVFNFNLAEFIRSGYGKHITVMEQEIRAFRDWEEDYSEEEKQKIVLKALLTLAYIAQDHRALTQRRSEWHSDSADCQSALHYHKPLLVMMGHTVNTAEADVKLFFRALAEIGKGEVAPATWQAAKQELWAELGQHPAYVFEDETVQLNGARFQALTLDDVRELVFNGRSTGEIEVLKRPSNQQEVAFKLKTAERPFALIKIGDITGWLKGELSGYEINETFEDESFFERLDADDSHINILMGSRTFYEGWDSNRPNVMCFVNIGMGTEARKFILQSIGRGVRIEPLPNARRRLLWLLSAGAVSRETFDRVQALSNPGALPIETLFIFGTNRSALHFVIDHLDQVQRKDEAAHTLALERNPEADEHRLLIPVFKLADHLLVEDRAPRKFETTAQERALLAAYIGAMDDRVLMARHGLAPERVAWLKGSVQAPDRYYRTDGQAIGHLGLLVGRAATYFGVVPQTFDSLKDLDDEIRHYRRIKVTLRDIYGLQKKIGEVKAYPVVRERLRMRYAQQQMTFDELEHEMKRLPSEASYTHDGQTIKVEHIAQHYYIPTLLAESKRVDYIQHIIQVPSEVAFVNALNTYAQQPGNRFQAFDWWLFSKLDEHLDDVALPYYDPKANRMRAFKPDFIFWLQKGTAYYIVFVDPKGTTYADYQHKIDGYRWLFEDDDGRHKVIHHEGLDVQIHAYLRTSDANVVSDKYRRYWFDEVQSIPERLVSCTL